MSQYEQELTGLLWWLSDKEFTCQCRRHRFDPWVRKTPWRRKWQHTSVFLPGKSHGQRSLAGYHPWGCKKSDKTQPPNNNIKKLKIKRRKMLILKFTKETWRSKHRSCIFPNISICDPMDCSQPGSSITGFSKQEYQNGLPVLSPGDLPKPGIEPSSPTLQADSLPSEPPGKHPSA